MKKVSLSYFVIGIALYTLSGCSSKHAEKADYTWLKYAIETSAAQYVGYAFGSSEWS